MMRPGFTSLHDVHLELQNAKEGIHGRVAERGFPPGGDNDFSKAAATFYLLSSFLLTLLRLLQPVLLEPSWPDERQPSLSRPCVHAPVWPESSAAQSHPRLLQEQP